MTYGIRDINTSFLNSVDLKNAKLGKDLAFLEGISKETAFIVDNIIKYSERFKIDLETTRVSCVIRKILESLLDSEDPAEYLLAKNIILYKKIVKKESRLLALKEENIDLREENIDLKEKNLKLKHTSTTDSLTGLVNRALLDYEIKKMLKLKDSTNIDFSILLIDIDNFKQINDRFGHLAGDNALIKLAKILKASFRKNDIIGRWGGEEFMVILPRIGVIDATDKADEIRKNIEKKFSSLKNPKEGKITVSIGVTQVETKNSSCERMMRKADSALYKCKDAGKNRVKIQLYYPDIVCSDKCVKCKHMEKCIKKQIF